VSQTPGNNGPTDRVYTLFTFDATPAGSNGCQVMWDLNQNLKFNQQSGSAQVDVIQVTGTLPQNPTWNNIVNANPRVLSTGTFGTTNAVAGTNAVVNTATCANSGTGLAFLVKLAGWVEQGNGPAVTDFALSTNSNALADLFVQHNC
jgi:hypothetical protein